jgi:Lrp/AsnC family leucine-responsive transcriptional regulator
VHPVAPRPERQHRAALVLRSGAVPEHRDVAGRGRLELRRVQRLERDGVIAGYRAELDPEHLGLGLQAFVRVQLRQHDPQTVEAFARSVNEWDEVVACNALTGDMDYLLQVMVRDLDHFSRFLLDRLLGQAGVADVNSSFVLRTVKPMRGLPLPPP